MLKTREEVQELEYIYRGAWLTNIKRLIRHASLQSLLISIF